MGHERGTECVVVHLKEDPPMQIGGFWVYMECFGCARNIDDLLTAAVNDAQNVGADMACHIQCAHTKTCRGGGFSLKRGQGDRPVCIAGDSFDDGLKILLVQLAVLPRL